MQGFVSFEKDENYSWGPTSLLMFLTTSLFHSLGCINSAMEIYDIGRFISHWTWGIFQLYISVNVFFVYGEHSSIKCPSDPDVKEKHRLGTELLKKTTEHRKKKPGGDWKNPVRDETSGRCNFCNFGKYVNFQFSLWKPEISGHSFGGGWVGDTFHDPWKLITTITRPCQARNVLNMTPKGYQKRVLNNSDGFMVSLRFNFFCTTKSLSNTIWQRESIESILCRLGHWGTWKFLGPRNVGGWNVRCVARAMWKKRWLADGVTRWFQPNQPLKRCWLVGDFHQKTNLGTICMVFL